MAVASHTSSIASMPESILSAERKNLQPGIFRLILIAIISLCLIACEETSDQEQIRQNIASVKKAVEMKSFSDIEKHLTRDFVANERLDANEVKQLLRMYSLRHKSIDATIIGSKTLMDPTYPDRAETTVSVIVTGSSGWLPAEGSVRTVKVQWVKLSENWKMRSATWQNYQ